MTGRKLNASGIGNDGSVSTTGSGDEPNEFDSDKTCGQFWVRGIASLNIDTNTVMTNAVIFFLVYTCILTT
jgi:hypothetical protein